MSITQIWPMWHYIYFQIVFAITMLTSAILSFLGDNLSSAYEGKTLIILCK